MPGARMNSPFARSCRSSAALRLPAMFCPLNVIGTYCARLMPVSQVRPWPLNSVPQVATVTPSWRTASASGRYASFTATSRPSRIKSFDSPLPKAGGCRDAQPQAAVDQTDTGFSSLEPDDLQKVVVSVVVWPFLVAVSSIGRQVLPSARWLGAASGLADTTVGGAEVRLVGSTV